VIGPIELPLSDQILPSGSHQPGLTFRDPAGQLQLTAQHALRHIHPSAIDDTLAFLSSPLRSALEQSGDLIQSEIASFGRDSSVVPGELWLEHPRVEPITYPWEWTPAQWRAAAELTLRVASQAIDAGWTLKDATPLNILFVGARPILVDVLSFERRDPGSKVWLAYGQFVRTFLLPLVAAKYLGWPLNATLLMRDGYEPSQIYHALQPWQRLNLNLLDVVTLATLLERPDRKSQTPPKPSTSADPDFTAHILQTRIARLRKQIHSTKSTRSHSRWSKYSQNALHYSPSDIHDKHEFVKNILQRTAPASVLDIGANTGDYSLLAANSGAKVVAIDADAAALETLWLAASRQNKPITTIAANIAWPTPASGWRNREHLSLLDRVAGKFDLLLMLAVIHHLILREQLPLSHIADLCASLSRRWLILEWVPPSDPMYQEWLRGRDHLYGNLTENDLARDFAAFFSIADRCELGNGRVLLLFERISNVNGSAAFENDRQTEPSLA